MDRLFALEERGTLVRLGGQGWELQIIRDGRIAAKYVATGTVSSSGTRLAWKTSFPYLESIDLTQPLPAEAPRLADGDIVVGDRIVRWLYKEENSAHEPSELFSTDFQGGDRRTIWKGFTTSPKSIDLERKNHPPRPETSFLRFGEVLFAEDGETWAVLDRDRAEIGRGGERTASICWSKNSIDWYPVKPTFDLACKRLLLAGRRGVSALSLDGEVLAHGALGRCASPPCFHRGELLVVVLVKESQTWMGPCDYEVHRLDPQTLQPLGVFSQLGTRREPEGEQALLSLSDGSLAWLSRTAPIRILPASDAWQPTSVIEIAGQPRVSSLAMPRKKPSQRALEARELLDELVDRSAIDRLFRFDPRAFAPWADGILAWDDDRLARLQTLDRYTWWQLARGASSTAVDAFAERARGELVRLLIGVDTDHSRAKLADMARRDRAVRKLCREHLLDVPKKGPAVRRFSPLRQEIVSARKRDPGLRSLEKTLSEGWSCRQTPYTLLSIPVPLKSPLKTHHFVLTGCEACDEWCLSYTLAGRGKKVELITTDERRRPKKRCPGSGYEKITIAPFKLDRPSQKPRRIAGAIGGWPEWWQGAEPPDCARCKSLMFFVGEVYASEVTDHVVDNALYGFHCEKCGVITNVVQCT